MSVVNVDVPASVIAEALVEDGYVIVEGLARDLTDRALAELSADIDATATGHTEFLGDRTKRLNSLLRRSAAAREMAVHPLVMALADAVLQPHCVRYQLNYSGAIHLLPGAAAQDLHRDGDLYPFRHPCPPTMMPTMWALTDFTAENGATLVVPGSHRWAEDRDPTEDEIISAVMPAGSLLVYFSGTIHAGGANVSRSTVRTGLALQYSLGWLRQEENQYLANPSEIARTYPERLQRLIGYDYGGPYLGFVEGDSPQRLLRPHDGPRNRTTPEIDALAAVMTRLEWGDVEAVVTPARSGSTVPVARGLINEPPTT